MRQLLSHLCEGVALIVPENPMYKELLWTPCINQKYYYNQKVVRALFKAFLYKMNGTLLSKKNFISHFRRAFSGTPVNSEKQSCYIVTIILSKFCRIRLWTTSVSKTSKQYY